VNEDMTMTIIEMTNVCYPDPSTVKGEVLADLISGKHITGLDCWRGHGSSRLASHIHALSKLGWLIHRETAKVTTSKGRTAVIRQYSLSPGLIANLGERAQQFVRDVQEAA